MAVKFSLVHGRRAPVAWSEADQVFPTRAQRRSTHRTAIYDLFQGFVKGVGQCGCFFGIPHYAAMLVRNLGIFVNDVTGGIALVSPKRKKTRRE
jgi:hypothetical protein